MAVVVYFADEEFEELLAGARAGGEDAFAILWRSYHPALVRFLGGRVGRDQAEDVASTVWLEVVRGLEGFDGNQVGFRSWLFAIARSRAIDLHRRGTRRPREVIDDWDETDRRTGPSPDPAALLERENGTQWAIALIGSLPPDQAEVILLRVVADLDVATVAQMTGKRPGTVRVLAHRGLRRLAEHLSAQGDVPTKGMGHAHRVEPPVVSTEPDLRLDVKALAADLRTAFICDPTPELSERHLAAMLQAVEASAEFTVRGRLARHRRSTASL